VHGSSSRLECRRTYDQSHREVQGSWHTSIANPFFYENDRADTPQIIWLNWGLTDEDMETLPAAVQRGFMSDTLQSTTNARRPWTGLGSNLGEGKGRCLFAGTWNADIYPPLKAHVLPSDLHCAKNRMSGLWSPEQPLWKTLKAEGKNTILFTGVNTDQCVLGTFVDGYNAGFNCVMVDDCCGTTTEGGKEITFYNVAVSLPSLFSDSGVVLMLVELVWVYH
jgi:phosphatidylethanolamine-binding protein